MQWAAELQHNGTAVKRAPALMASIVSVTVGESESGGAFSSPAAGGDDSLMDLRSVCRHPMIHSRHRCGMLAPRIKIWVT